MENFSGADFAGPCYKAAMPERPVDLSDPIKGMPTGNTDPLPLEKLVEYLRELKHSVERHTQLGGRCGYLEFVRRYAVPCSSTEESAAHAADASRDCGRSPQENGENENS